MSKIFLAMFIIVLMGSSSASDWFSDVPSSTGSGSTDLVKSCVGSTISIDSDAYGNNPVDVLDYNSGWILVKESDGETAWVNSNRITAIYIKGKIGEEIPTEDAPFALLSMLGLVAAVLIVYRRQH